MDKDAIRDLNNKIEKAIKKLEALDTVTLKDKGTSHYDFTMTRPYPIDRFTFLLKLNSKLTTTCQVTFDSSDYAYPPDIYFEDLKVEVEDRSLLLPDEKWNLNKEDCFHCWFTAILSLIKQPEPKERTLSPPRSPPPNSPRTKKQSQTFDTDFQIPIPVVKRPISTYKSKLATSMKRKSSITSPQRSPKRAAKFNSPYRSPVKKDVEICHISTDDEEDAIVEETIPKEELVKKSGMDDLFASEENELMHISDDEEDSLAYLKSVTGHKKELFEYKVEDKVTSIEETKSTVKNERRLARPMNGYKANMAKIMEKEEDSDDDFFTFPMPTKKKPVKDIDTIDLDKDDDDFESPSASTKTTRRLVQSLEEPKKFDFSTTTSHKRKEGKSKVSTAVASNKEWRKEFMTACLKKYPNAIVSYDAKKFMNFTLNFTFPIDKDGQKWKKFMEAQEAKIKEFRRKEGVQKIGAPKPYAPMMCLFRMNDQAKKIKIKLISAVNTIQSDNPDTLDITWTYNEQMTMTESVRNIVKYIADNAEDFHLELNKF